VVAYYGKVQVSQADVPRDLVVPPPCHMCGKEMTSPDGVLVVEGVSGPGSDPRRVHEACHQRSSATQWYLAPVKVTATFEPARCAICAYNPAEKDSSLCGKCFDACAAAMATRRLLGGQPVPSPTVTTDGGSSFVPPLGANEVPIDARTLDELRAGARRAAFLSDEAGRLVSENRELLAENARLRRALERAEQKPRGGGRR
jgi:hypothetical protein